ncbi:hypothetical protein [Candidatus Nitrotoga sp. BS]|uniref:hypothetical protein n=1 Tax=Candidatus Nitrotoga sp. BS TaxID=2890408 RepID=UPI001EF2DA79|nr:hypothetical protein [Candidatus Nitrotoga sp. BS]
MMPMMIRLTTYSLSLLILLPSITALTGCEQPHSGAREMAIELSGKIKKQVCLQEYRPGDPCGTRNVQGQADAGTTVHIYIYGISDKSEIQSLIEFTTKLRDEKNKSIPIDLRFYREINSLITTQFIRLDGK